MEKAYIALHSICKKWVTQEKGRQSVVSFFLTAVDSEGLAVLNSVHFTQTEQNDSETVLKKYKHRTSHKNETN